MHARLSDLNVPQFFYSSLCVLLFFSVFSSSSSSSLMPLVLATEDGSTETCESRLFS